MMRELYFSLKQEELSTDDPPSSQEGAENKEVNLPQTEFSFLCQIDWV